MSPYLPVIFSPLVLDRLYSCYSKDSVDMVNQLFISYRQESPEHRRAVRRLGELLLQAGITVALDEFFADDYPGGPDSGWPKWCEDCANESQCVLVVASEGWFAAYDQIAPPGEGLGAATEADLIRQNLYDEKGNNSRIRLAFLHEVSTDKIPKRLRAWHQFWPLKEDEQLHQLIRWVGGRLGIKDLQVPTAHWPVPVPFQPDLADRNKKEWPAIVDLLAGCSRERILLFEGNLNVGKSELLRQAKAYAEKLRIPVAPIDFKGGNVGIQDVLGQLDLEIGKHLPNFLSEGANNTNLLRKDLRALKQPVLLTFDSYEEVADNKAVADWLSQQLFREVETALAFSVIVAGRRVPDIQKVPWRAVARHLVLANITEPEPWEEWMERRYPALSNKHFLRDLVKCTEGSPGLMKMLCDNFARES